MGCRMTLFLFWCPGGGVSQCIRSVGFLWGAILSGGDPFVVSIGVLQSVVVEMCFRRCAGRVFLFFSAAYSQGLPGAVVAFLQLVLCLLAIASV